MTIGSVVIKTSGRTRLVFIAVMNLTFSTSPCERYLPPSDNPRSLRSLAARRRRMILVRVSGMTRTNRGTQAPSETGVSGRVGSAVALRSTRRAMASSATPRPAATH